MRIFAVDYVYGPEAEAARAEHRPAHREWLAVQADAEVVLASGPYGDGTGALLIFRAENEAALEEILVQDPLSIGGGVASRTFNEWKPVVGQLKNYAV